MRIAVLGLGAMGSALARKAIDAGHEVAGWNRSPGKELATHDTAVGAVEGAEVVDVLVYDAAGVREVLSDELVAALAPGAVVAVTATVGPGTIVELGERLPGRLVDAPVLGSPKALEGGNATFVLGGPDDAVAAVTRALEGVGTVLHCGGPGAGAVMKLAGNVQLVAGVAAMAEAIEVARRNGIDESTIREVFGQIPVVSAGSRLRLDAVLDPEHPGWFPARAAAKDMRLFQEIADGTKLAVVPAGLELLERIEHTHNDDFAALIDGL